MNRNEMFDEADLDAALARFDELSRPAPQLENAASQVYERYFAHFKARDGPPWQSARRRFTRDDRRRVVNAGVRRGRTAEIANLRGLAEVGAKIVDRPCHPRASALSSSAFSRLRTGREFDPAGSTSSKSTPTTGSRHTSRSIPTTSMPRSRSSTPVISPAKRADTPTRGLSSSRKYAAFNRHELPPTTPDCVSIDHHRATFAPGELTANLRAVWNQTPDDQVPPRGCASAERHRSGRNPRGAWNLA